MAGKKERQRRLAREHYQRQETKRAQRARRLRTGTIAGVAAGVMVALAVGGFLVFSGNGKPASASATPTPAAASTSALAATPTPSSPFVSSIPPIFE